jgi:hypothetical protein
MAKGMKTITAKNPKTDEVYGDQRFFLSNGQVISRLNDLCEALKSMDDNTYNYHVNGDRNDFASWISDVFLNKPLASRISKSKNRYSMASTIEEYLR